LISVARERGDREIELFAQDARVGVLSRYGFAETGPVFERLGSPHQAMRKKL
jgi:predicted GNAT family N-acyltransferase